MKKIFLLIVGGGVLVYLATRSYAASAVAEIKPTADDSVIAGQVTFEEVMDGIKVTAEVSHVTPGKHGFHIHENGACGEAGKAAGGHFNPDAMPHGLLAKDGLMHAHAGDLGNIEINAEGNGKLETTVQGLTLTEGKYNILGKAVILHEKEDDFGQPTGNAGARIGCGIIEISQ